jgi:hypothetical protein
VSGDIGSDLLKRLEMIREDIIMRAENALKQASDAGADAMRHNISTRPTTWMRENRGKTGRIETGAMLEAVESKVSKDGHSLTGEWGWIDTQKAYFLVQENGGVNSFTGGSIEAMEALRDASIVAQEAFAKAMR